MTGLRRAVVLIALLCCAGGCTGAPFVYATDGGRYGKVRVVEPEHRAIGFVIFFSGEHGLTAADAAAARTLAGTGALVAEVDTAAYLKRLDKLDEKCHYLAVDAEALSRQVQRARGFPNYLTPILAGVNEGGTLAAMALSTAPQATIAGAVSLDPSAVVTSWRPICTSGSIKALAHGFRYGAPKKLPGFWTVGLTPGIPKANREYVMALRRDGASFELREFSRETSIGDALRAIIEPHLTKPKARVTDISTLPLTILGVGHPSKVMAVVISGDGGWRDLDRTIAENLQHLGIPVVGWDSLRYFWSRKTPQQTAAALALVLQTFMARWHASEVALIGYSFGADVMPFAYNRLPDTLRSHVVLIALLGFAKEADFEITVGGWLGEPPGPEALPVLPEADKIPPRLMQCFYGHDEKDTACPDLARRGAEVIRTAGGHHFGGDYEALTRDILAAFKRRVATSSSAASPLRSCPIPITAKSRPRHP
jgi:type IV secretory pathway VirJ component